MKKCANPLTSLENLSRNIAGFTGYKQPEQRERSDRLYREFLIKQMKSLIKSLGHKIDVDTADLKKNVDENVNSTKRKLLTISESLKNPTYEGTPFFKKIRLSDELITSIYENECRMLEAIKNISDEIKAIISPGIDQYVLEDSYLHIHDYLDALNQYLFERESLILGEY
ncbi:hypothetical protein JXQ31_19570 [candidate division KSB1 bacterium]|nr:hypothetical protein [candidate division KSB1 bacterium]